MGATYLCYRLKVLGVDVTGGMQEYWAVPAARLLKLPDSVSDHDAPLIEPLAVATPTSPGPRSSPAIASSCSAAGRSAP